MLGKHIIVDDQHERFKHNYWKKKFKNRVPYGKGGGHSFSTNRDALTRANHGKIDSSQI